MDSITQIALGAAVGEACLGKKIGNRAMLWGGIAGTIPDLDVFAKYWMGDLDAMAFHRGPTHSILFSFIWPLVIGWLVHKLYSSGLYKKQAYKWSIYVLSFFVIGGFFFGIYSFTSEINNGSNLGLLLTLGAVLLGIYFLLWKSYLFKDLEEFQVSYKSWIWFFFWTTITHPLLDSCTSYGTQLFWPFANTRVAWDNISVADPFFTVPFVLFILSASFLSKKNPWRSILNYTGIAVASLYMLWTFRNHAHVMEKFSEYMSRQETTVEKMKVTPSILNNILWYGVAKTEDGFYRGWHSLLDKSGEVDTMFYVPSGYEYIKPYEGQREVEILQWFSDDLYHLAPKDSDTLYYYDLRFGFSTDTVNYSPESVFGYKMVPKKDIIEVAAESRGPREGNFSSIFKAFIMRIRGL